MIIMFIYFADDLKSLNYVCIQIVLACLLGVACAIDDQSTEESGIGLWRGNGWGRHDGCGWSRVGSSPWGGSSWGRRHARSVEDLNEEENGLRSWSGNHHGSSRGSWGSSHPNKPAKSAST